MKTFIPTMLLALMFVSCNQERDVKKLRQVFSETKYDEDIIESLPLYDSLKSIIISNIDTIFKYRNSRNFVFHSNGKDTATVQEDANSYQFYYNYGEATALSYGTGANDQKLIDGVSVENMPAFIYPSINTIFRKLGKRKIRGFTLWKDSTIEISVKAFRQDNIEVGHTLTWKRMFAKNTEADNFYRDTLIAPMWTYVFWVDQRMGW
jgi:hypothetical protein